MNDADFNSCIEELFQATENTQKIAASQGGPTLAIAEGLVLIASSITFLATVIYSKKPDVHINGNPSITVKEPK